MGIIEKLVTGFTYFYDEPGEAELKESYFQHRGYFMEFIGKRARDIEPDFFPAGATGIPIPWGHRCWGWWEYEAPEPRLLLSGDPSLAMPELGLWFGVPNYYQSQKAQESLVYESQPEYLERLGLLLPGEKVKLEKATK
jgi:hypothetical protein